MPLKQHAIVGRGREQTSLVPYHCANGDLGTPRAVPRLPSIPAFKHLVLVESGCKEASASGAVLDIDHIIDRKPTLDVLPRLAAVS